MSALDGDRRPVEDLAAELYAEARGFERGWADVAGIERAAYMALARQSLQSIREGFSFRAEDSPALAKASRHKSARNPLASRPEPA